jgi:hypothetical protein
LSWTKSRRVRFVWRSLEGFEGWVPIHSLIVLADF